MNGEGIDVGPRDDGADVAGDVKFDVVRSALVQRTVDGRTVG